MTDIEKEILYCEVLYALLHAKTHCANSDGRPIDCDHLFKYLKTACQFSDEKHEELLSTVRQRNPPEVPMESGVRDSKKYRKLHRVVSGAKFNVFLKQKKTKAKEPENAEIIFPAKKTNGGPCTYLLQESTAKYEQLFTITVKHELQSNTEWRGNLPILAITVLNHFAAYQGLNPSLTDFCSWSVYSAALHNRTLDFGMLLPLIQRLRNVVDNSKLPEELVDVFWTAANSFVSAALFTIQNLRNNPELNKEPEQLQVLLECLKELTVISPTRMEFSEMKTRIVEAITMGATDFLVHQVARDSTVSVGPAYDDGRLEHVLCISQSLIVDIKTLLKVHNKIFAEQSWLIPAFSLVYMYYDGHLVDLCKPVVDNAILTLGSIHSTSDHIRAVALVASGSGGAQRSLVNDEEQENEIDTRLVIIIKSLWELYLLLQEFCKLSTSLSDGQKEEVKMSSFYTWFEPAVIHWMDIAMYQALIWIDKAVSLDQLEVDQTLRTTTKCSSSAVDVVHIFYQHFIHLLKTLSLAYPKMEMTFAIRIIFCIRICSDIYASAIWRKLKGIHADERLYVISTETCTAINSVLYVQQKVEALVEELGLSACDSVEQTSTPFLPSLDPWQQALLHKAIKDVNDKLEEITVRTASSLEAEVCKLISATLESSFDTSQTDKVGEYISNQLDTLHLHVDQDVFCRILDATHNRTLQSFFSVIKAKIGEKHRPTYFRQLQELLNFVDNLFIKDPDVKEKNKTSTEVLRLLELHGMDTSKLIQLYRLERMKRADSHQDIGLGSLTIQATFIEDTLIVKVLNGRKLTPMGSDGLSNPYFKVHLLPSNHFPKKRIFTSKVKRGTLYPLFEENVVCPIIKSLQTNPECCVKFTLYDSKAFVGGFDEFMGECFLSFTKIAHNQAADDMENIDQVVLPLTKPTEKDLEYLKVLENRNSWDKTARNFAKQEMKNMIINGK